MWRPTILFDRATPIPAADPDVEHTCVELRRIAALLRPDYPHVAKYLRNRALHLRRRANKEKSDATEG
jgi:hypothetical protein